MIWYIILQDQELEFAPDLRQRLDGLEFSQEIMADGKMTLAIQGSVKAGSLIFYQSEPLIAARVKKALKAHLDLQT